MTRPSTDTTPDVGAVLERLRAEVRSRRLARGVAEQGGYERDVRRALDEIELHRVVSAHWPLTARSPLERAINLVHKVVRRYLRWYINPIVEQQNAYNEALARTVRLLADAYLDLAEQVAETRAEGGGGPAPDSGHAPPPAAGSWDGAVSRPEPEGQGASAADLDAVHALVRAAARSEPPARFPDLELRAVLAALRARTPVTAHWPLGGTTLAQQVVALHNKAVRQYLRWYINPIVEQQNAANDALAAAIGSLARLDEQRRAQVAALRAAASRAGRE